MGKLKILLISSVIFVFTGRLYSQPTISLYQITSSANHKSETSIDIDPNDNTHFFVGSNVRIGTSPTRIGYYYSNNEGTSWTTNENFDNEHRVDPSVSYDISGNIYYCFIKPDDNGSLDEVHIKKSTNNGINWVSDIKLSSSYSDKSYMIVDKKPTSSYVNNIYAVWAINLNNVCFKKSSDGGSTYSNIQYLNGNYHPIHCPIPATGPNGEVYVVWAIGTTPVTGIGFNKSVNGGASFGNASQIVSVSQIGSLSDGRYHLKNTGINVNSWPSIDVDKNNGNIYVVWADNSDGNPDIFLIKSTDGGSSWSDKLKVNNDNSNNDQWFPWVNVGDDGGVNVVYYDSRNDVANLSTQVYVSRSTDQGNTFSDYQITEYSFTPKPIPGSPLVGYMGDYIGLTSSESKVYPCWMDDHIGDTFQIYMAQVDFPNRMIVDQTEEIQQTNRIPLQVGRWEGGSSYHFRDVPFTLPVTPGINEYLVGSSELYSNEKFHKWNVEDYYTLMDTFEIDLGTNRFNSLFSSSFDNATIQNNYPESPNLNPQNDIIRFADPWLNDIAAPFDETLKINEGINSHFKDRYSPFYPDYTTSYGGNIYKGVFLNQIPDPQDPAKPYYSVKAEAVQDIDLGGDIGTRTFWFQNWSGTNVQFQDSTATQTGVVFTNDGAVVKANFKGHLLSSTSSATSGSNQRKVAVYNSTKCAVYESGGEIWFTKNNGSGWSDEKLLSTYREGNAKSPAIAVGYSTPSLYVHVVWETYNPDLNIYDGIFYMRSTDGGETWSTIKTIADDFSYFRSVQDATPCVEADGSGAIVAWRYGDNSTYGGIAALVQPASNSNILTFTSTNLSSRNPSLGQGYRADGGGQAFLLAYDNSGGSVYYKEFNINYYSPYNITYQSSAVLIVSENSASHPSVSGSIGDKNTFVTWEGLNGGNQRVYIRERNSSGTWLTQEEISDGTNELTQPSVKIDLSSNKVFLLWQDDSKIAIKSKTLGSSSWSGIYYFGTGYNPGLSQHTDGLSSTLAMWVSENTAPYLINISSLAATNVSGTIASNTIWSGFVNVTGTVTVNSGVTLSISPGTIVSFANGASLIVNGVLNANGISGQQITLTSVSGTTPGSWGSIVFSGSSASSSIINDCQVKYGSEIQCLNNADVTISNSSIENCTNGIYINNSAPEIINNAILEPQQNGIYGTLATNYPLIENNTITKTSSGSGSYYHNYQGIWFTDHSQCLIAHNDVSGFYWGGYFWGSVYTLFADEMEGVTNPSNRFTECFYGIGSAYGSSVEAGSSYGGGYNTFYNNSWNDVRCYSSSWVYARYCYWGGGQPHASVDAGSYFYYDPILTYDPWGSTSQQIASVNSPNMLSTSASLTESKNVNTEDPDPEEFLNGLKLERSGDIERAISQYKKLIDNEAFTSFALTALSRIKTKYSRPDIGTYLDNLSVSKSKYKQEIMNLSANSLLLEGKYDEAMELYDQAIDINPSSDDAVNSLFEKFFAALNYKNDQSAAEKLLDKIKSVSTENEDFMMRRELAGSMLNGTSNSYQNTVNKSNVLNKNSSNELPKEYNLLGNYPNPFNPSTTISYALPYQSSVELIIYDIMGREIKSFNIFSQTAGYNKLVWDGRNEIGNTVTSGVYFYRISIKSLENDKTFVKTAKLMMLK